MGLPPRPARRLFQSGMHTDSAISASVPGTEGLGLLWRPRNVSRNRGVGRRGITGRATASCIRAFSVRAAFDQIGAARFAIVAGRCVIT